MNIQLEKLPHGAHLPTPSYATKDSAGMDLYAAISAPITLQPLGRTLVETGFKMALPSGFEAQIRPRSGLAFKHGLTVLNAPGTIDADYRGEVKVLLVNLSDQPYTIEPDTRIAQMIIAQVVQGTWVETDNLDETVRGAGGFGSTGVAA